jgi:hypothetical protein
MRLFYRINDSQADSGAAKVLENTTNIQQLPCNVVSPIKSKEFNDNLQKIEQPATLSPLPNNENNDPHTNAKVNKVSNDGGLAQEDTPVSILSNIENKIVTPHHDESSLLLANQIEMSNNKDTTIDDINNTINNQTLNNTNTTTATTTTTTTTATANTNIHNTSNANDNSLTITSMVASINKEKKQMLISSSSSSNIQANDEDKYDNNNNDDDDGHTAMSNNDKENEEFSNLNNSILKQQQTLTSESSGSSSKKLLINTSNLLGQNEVILAGNPVNTSANINNTAQQPLHLITDELKPNIANNTNNIKSEKLILPKLPVVPTNTLAKDASLKPLKPKKQYNKTNKKELLPKPNANSNEPDNAHVEKGNGESGAVTTTTTTATLVKKVKKPKVPNELKQPKQPKKPKQEKTLVKKEPHIKANVNHSSSSSNAAPSAPASAAVVSNLQQVLAQFQQQQQQQNNYFQHQQQQQQQHIQPNFSLPSFVNNKLPVTAPPAASSTPAPSPHLQNNFQIMPMSSLMNSLYPWKQFEGYNNQAVAGMRKKFFLKFGNSPPPPQGNIFLERNFILITEIPRI